MFRCFSKGIVLCCLRVNKPLYLRSHFLSKINFTISVLTPLPYLEAISSKESYKTDLIYDVNNGFLAFT